MLNPEKQFVLDPRRYITSAIKKDKVTIWQLLILSKSFQMYHKNLF